MSAKLISLAILFCLIALPAQSQTLIAPLYPSSVSCETGQAGCFLSKDSFDQVAAFYEKEKGPATVTQNEPERNRYSFYEYMDVNTVHQYDPIGSAIGVRIYSKPVPVDDGTSLPVVGEVFGKLKLLIVQGSMSMEEYNALVEKYRYLAAWYFPMEKGPTPLDRPVPQNKIILDRCEKGPQAQKAAEDMEAMAMKAQQLMMQGRQREALALLQRAGESAQGIHAKSLGPEGIEKWEGCLEELQANGYPTRIEIAVNPSK